MKVCLVAHGYPPELLGGTEQAVQGLARGLVAGGDEVVVVAGSLDHGPQFRISEATDEVDGRPFRVVRLHRGDLYFDHWQKSASTPVAEAFREILRVEQPDVVHVHHWIRLSRDLVATAAALGIPAVVTLHDLWTSCLVTFRVKPDTREFCEASLAPNPCLDCAKLVPPRTPWVSTENLFMAFAARREDLARELDLARAVIAPSRSHADNLARFLGLGDVARDLRVVAPGRELETAEQPPLAPPADLGRLVLGSWGHMTPLKGADLVIGAVRRLADAVGKERVELHLAGEEPDAAFATRLDTAAEGLPVTRHGGYPAGGLAAHPVSAAHVMVSGTRAPESWGLVVDEAAALRLPMVLPRAGAFVERFEEGRGALFYQPGDEAGLAAVLRRLLDEPELLPALRASLPATESIAPGVAAHVAAVRGIYDEVVAAGPPAPPPDEWWRARMQYEAEKQWDEALSRTPPEELGLA